IRHCCDHDTGKNEKRNGVAQHGRGRAVARKGADHQQRHGATRKNQFGKRRIKLEVHRGIGLIWRAQPFVELSRPSASCPSLDLTRGLSTASMPLPLRDPMKTWMAGTSPAMTPNMWFHCAQHE